MQHADGEILAARAARKFGVPFTLSTMSICSIEDVAKHAGPGFWFQLYVMRDRGFIERLIDRAKAAQCSALVLTLDLQILGQRHKDLKNGLSAPPKPTLINLLDLANVRAGDIGIVSQSGNMLLALALLGAMLGFAPFNRPVATSVAVSKVCSMWTSSGWAAPGPNSTRPSADWKW